LGEREVRYCLRSEAYFSILTSFLYGDPCRPDRHAESQAIELFYVIAGNDSEKPDLLCTDIRQAMAHDKMRLFSPRFANSSTSPENSLDREPIIFRILTPRPV